MKLLAYKKKKNKKKKRKENATEHPEALELSQVLNVPRLRALFLD